MAKQQVSESDDQGWAVQLVPLGVSVRGPIAEEHHVEALANDLFGIVVTKTLVPIFNTLIDAILTWVFGKPLFEALAERI